MNRVLILTTIGFHLISVTKCSAFMCNYQPFFALPATAPSIAVQIQPGVDSSSYFLAGVFKDNVTQCMNITAAPISFGMFKDKPLNVATDTIEGLDGEFGFVIFKKKHFKVGSKVFIPHHYSFGRGDVAPTPIGKLIKIKSIELPFEDRL